MYKHQREKAKWEIHRLYECMCEFCKVVLFNRGGGGENPRKLVLGRDMCAVELWQTRIHTAINRNQWSLKNSYQPVLGSLDAVLPIYYLSFKAKILWKAFIQLTHTHDAYTPWVYCAIRFLNNIVFFSLSFFWRGFLSLHTRSISRFKIYLCTKGKIQMNFVDAIA